MSMKFRKICALALALSMMVSLVACGNSGDKGNASSEPVELSFSMHDSAATSKYTYTQEWCDSINEAAGGDVNITVYPGGSIAGVAEALDALDAGTCDIAMIYTSFYDAVMPKLNAVNLPVMGVGDAVDATKVLWDLYEQVPEVAAEFEDYKLCQMYSSGASYMLFTEKAAATYADVKGMKMRCDSGAMVDFLAAAEAIPQVVTVPETYEALEKGIVEGGICTGSLVKSWNLGEVLSYGLDMPCCVGIWLTLMNKDAYDKLSDDAKAAIDAVSGRESSLANAEILQAENESAFSTLVDAGTFEWLTPSDADVEQFAAAAQVWKDQWIEKNTTDDFDAAAYLVKVDEIIKANT